MAPADTKAYHHHTLYTDSSSTVANVDASRVLIICHDGDDICQFGDIITFEHLTYAENVTAAASFVVSAAGL